MKLLRTLIKPFRDYAHWLHLRWPAGVPEALPEVGPDGATAIPGVRIAGDLLGIPLLKFATNSGAKAVRAFIAENAFEKPLKRADTLDLAIIGGGVAGLSAALEAQRAGLDFRVFEASEPFSTVANFTKGKPIFTYPTDMQPASELRLSATVKEDLLAELRAQADSAGVRFEVRRVERVVRKGGLLEVGFADAGSMVRAKRVLICTGKSGDHRKLGVPGEVLDKVYNRLFDPKDYLGKNVLVVGGGDSALEAAVSLAEVGARVHVSYRKAAFSRPKPENVERAGRLLGDRILFQTEITRIELEKVCLRSGDGQDLELPNDAVFVLIGREAPVEFFQRSGIPLLGGWSIGRLLSLAFAFSLVLLLYRWKTEGSGIADLFLEREWFPYNVNWYDWATHNLFTRVLQNQVGKPGFYYELAYTAVIVIFGARRILRYNTPYIRWQTLSLALIQLVPLFLLPYFILPLLGEWGIFDTGAGAWVADQLFPAPGEGAPREYWRSVGFILAWPLFIWNVFTPAPQTLWLLIALLQTFVLIPWLVYRYGKGAYCGWICSCGALAETLGDAYRTKMPHGPGWNRLNLAGQVILGVAFLILIVRVLGWSFNGSAFGDHLETLFAQMSFGYAAFGIPLNYSAVVDYFLAGILGLGLYFHFSGRTWCRFFCPLAALMNIYARFSRFRIFANKDKCISCNACTTVCHQGIDIMSFANKGLAMEDPQCVRCSACVYTCPTGTLSFGRLGPNGRAILDTVPASPVQMREVRP